MNENKKIPLWHEITIDFQERQKLLEALFRFCPSVTPPRLVWHLQPLGDKAYTVSFPLNDSTQLSIVEWRPDENGEWERVCGHSDYQELLTDLERVAFARVIPPNSPESVGFSTMQYPQ